MQTICNQLGVQKGDRVAIMLPNCPQGVLHITVHYMQGAIVVQTNPLYTEREIAYQMKDSGAKVIFAMDILYPRVTKVLKETDLKILLLLVLKITPIS